MSLQLRQIGGISGEEHAVGVASTVAEVFNNNSDCVKVVGGFATPPGPQPVRSAPSSKGKDPATKSGSATSSKPVYRGVGEQSWVAVWVVQRRDPKYGLFQPNERFNSN